MNSIEDVEVWIERMPEKRIGNLDTIGQAYNAVLPKLRDRIDAIGIDYVSIIDVDIHPCPNYFSRMMWLMHNHQEIGAAAGFPIGEKLKRRVGLPMGAGKVIRWSIMRDILTYWDIAPDTLLNIKTLSAGKQLKTWPVPMHMDKPTTAFSKSGVYRQGRLNFYVGRPFWAVLFRALRRLLLNEYGTEMLRGYLYERQRGTWRFNDPDVKSYFNRGRNPVSALLDVMSYAGMKE